VRLRHACSTCRTLKVCKRASLSVPRLRALGLCATFTAVLCTFCAVSTATGEVVKAAAEAAKLSRQSLTAWRKLRLTGGRCNLPLRSYRSPSNISSSHRLPCPRSCHHHIALSPPAFIRVITTSQPASESRASCVKVFIHLRLRKLSLCRTMCTCVPRRVACVHRCRRNIMCDLHPISNAIHVQWATGV
jgi:hypothetical protein